MKYRDLNSHGITIFDRPLKLITVDLLLYDLNLELYMKNTTC